MNESKKFWLVISDMFGVLVLCLYLFFWLVGQMLEGVTLEGVAEDVGRATKTLSEAYERGQNESQ